MFKKVFKRKMYIYCNDQQSYISYSNNLYIMDNLTDKQKYDNIMNFAHQIINESKGMTYKEHPILDFIKILGRRIQADYMGYLLYSGKDENQIRDLEAQEILFKLNSLLDKNGNFINVNNIIETKKIDKKVNLSKDLVLPWPWKKERIQNCILKIGEGREWGKWKPDYSNHCIEVWLPMGIVWVHGGNHSITLGIIQGGELKPYKYSDISKLYDYIKCDGENFIEINTGNYISRVKSPEFAAIFEIGRLMSENGISYII